jgi:serine/threonine protein kinase
VDLQPGQEIDRYTVVDKIGRGGMAEVYRVRHNTLGTDYALKVLSLNVPSIRERLIQEGRVQAQLEHPNIVAVTDVLDIQGSPGLLMQLIKGPSLEDWLRGNRPPLDEALRIFDGILSALQEAHRLDIVHRDLKPGNVMLSTQRGELLPKVTDFGLAKLLADEADPGHTRTGLPMGTPAYMSPEQITDAKGVDRRTDIFALGCILYELVCGQMAFRGANTLEVFNAVAGGHYVPPRDISPDLPAPVVAAIQGCLQPQRDLRIPSCEALAATLAGESLSPSEAPTLAPELSRPTAVPIAPEPRPSQRPPADPTFAPIEPPPAEDPEPKRSSSSLWLLLAIAAVVVAGLGVVMLGGGVLGWMATRSAPTPDERPATATVEPAAPEPLPDEAPAAPDPQAEAPTLRPVVPEPAPEPVTPDKPPAQATPTGLVVVTGDASSVVLIDDRSRRHPPGRLPPGTYDLEASFAGGATIRQPDRVTVRAGQTTTLRCVALMETCR